MLWFLLGRSGERLAARRLRQAGYRVLARNYRAAGGELDLVAADSRTLLFVEVKTRQRHAEWLDQSVPREKRLKIAHAARHFMETRRLGHLLGRFDVMLVDAERKPPEIEWIQGAFEVPAGPGT